MDKDNKLIFEAFDNSRQNAQLEKQIKMLVNNALRATFAAIETLEGVDSLPYSGEIDALTVNLDEEVGRLMDILDKKMPKSEEEDNIPPPPDEIRPILKTASVPPPPKEPGDGRPYLSAS